MLERAATSSCSATSSRWAALLAVMAFGLPLGASAQDERAIAHAGRPRNFLYADLSLGVLAIGYGYDVTDWLEVQLTAQYYQPWYIVDGVRGVGGELRLVAVPLRAAEHALIVVEGARLAATCGALGQIGIAYSARTSIGYELTIDWFRQQIACGFQHHAVEGLAAPGSFSGLYPAVDLLLGWVL